MNSLLAIWLTTHGSTGLYPEACRYNARPDLDRWKIGLSVPLQRHAGGQSPRRHLSTYHRIGVVSLPLSLETGLFDKRSLFHTIRVYLCVTPTCVIISFFVATRARAYRKPMPHFSCQVALNRSVFPHSCRRSSASFSTSPRCVLTILCVATGTEQTHVLDLFGPIIDPIGYRLDLNTYYDKHDVPVWLHLSTWL